jgi:hypothetical protein
MLGISPMILRSLKVSSDSTIGTLLFLISESSRLCLSNDHFGSTLATIGDWLAVRPGSVMIGTDLIFVALDRATIGHRITGHGIYKLVQRKAKKTGTDSLKIPQLCKSYQFLNL